MLAQFITWDLDPEIFRIGAFSLRYYGLLFALGFMLGYKVEEYIFKAEGRNMVWLDKLLMYVAIATIVGARLGHCIFYDWEYFQDHLLEMVLPFSFEPTIKFTGFQGLASHGAAIGIILGVWFYSKRITKKSIFWTLDRVVIPVALAGAMIRLGNFMNSEIIGLPTDMPWGMQFLRAHIENPEIPRHPTQLYESFSYFISFGILMYIYWKTNLAKQQGFIFGAFLVLIFGFRFFVEYAKEIQSAWEADMFINMGQILSLPFVAVGIFMMWFSKKLPDTEKLKNSNKK